MGQEIFLGIINNSPRKNKFNATVLKRQFACQSGKFVNNSLQD